jgi:hypothetical protein
MVHWVERLPTFATLGFPSFIYTPAIAGIPIRSFLKAIGRIKDLVR